MQLPFSPTKSKSKLLKKYQASLQRNLRSSNQLNKIKSEIQQVLKRHRSPLPLITSSPIKKQQKSVQKQYINQNSAKKYIKQGLSIKQSYDSLFTSIPSPHKQFIDPFNLNTQDRKPKQTIYYDKNKSYNQTIFERQLSMSKNDFYTQNLTEKHLLKNCQQKKLGLGRILFKKDKNVKLRRQDLLSTISNYSQRHNQYIKFDNPSLTHRQSQVDINQYIASAKSTTLSVNPINLSINLTTLSGNSTNLQHNRSFTKLNLSKQTQIQKQLKNQKSLQIFKKTIIAKESNLSLNPQGLNIVGSFKQHRNSHTKRHNQRNPSILMAQQLPIINFKDQQLLVYYGRLKKKSLQNKHNHNQHRLNFISKHQLPEMPEITKKSYFRKTSKGNFIQLNRKQQIEKFDPWERTKIQDQQHEHQFLSYQAHIPQQQTNCFDRPINQFNAQTIYSSAII